MQRCITILVIIVFIIFSSTANSIELNQKNANITFSPKDMDIKDDAFHSSDRYNYLEWWYFDAVFDNGYSVIGVISIIGLLKADVVNVVVNVYKDGEDIFNKNKFYPLSELKASTTEPYIMLNNKQLMKGFLDETKNQIFYDLSLKIDDTELNLRFINNTKAWQGQTLISSWGVMLPNSKVFGEIKLEGQQIAVTGRGYHDHNWNFSLESFINFRWFWGKINSDRYSIVWSDILENSIDNPLVVVNENNDGYINIPPEDIQFTLSNYSNNNGIEIPNTFEIKVDKENIFLDIKMETIKIDYHSYVNVLRYWRYYLKCTGIIRINNKEEKINQNNLAEFMRLVDINNIHRPANRFNGLLKCLLAQIGTSYKPGINSLFSSLKTGLSSLMPHFLHLNP